MTKSEAKRLKAILSSGDVRASLGIFLAQQNAMMGNGRRAFRPMKQQRLAKKKATREEQNAETARIRGELIGRAMGVCECGCGMWFTSLNPAEMDHFLGGTGRRKQRQSVGSCWMLRRDCHLMKTSLSPSAAFWNSRFAAHAAHYNYPALKHIEHAALRRSTP